MSQGNGHKKCYARCNFPPAPAMLYHPCASQITRDALRLRDIRLLWLEELDTAVNLGCEEYVPFDEKFFSIGNLFNITVPLDVALKIDVTELPEILRAEGDEKGAELIEGHIYTTRSKLRKMGRKDANTCAIFIAVDPKMCGVFE